ncbi:WD40 repeat-like protein [Lanmaoa asiatica]|nr:WD40 repeat-like protein [Lanmaoa asiatica]
MLGHTLQIDSRYNFVVMRAQHTAHPLTAFPVYSCAFIADDQVIVGGGGGASRTGIKNKLRLFRVSDDRQLHILNELELEKGEDAPMSMAAHPQSRTLVCGINSSPERLEKGENENCRKFSVSTDELKYFSQCTHCSPSLTSGNLDDYQVRLFLTPQTISYSLDLQRVTVLSPNGRYLVIAGAHDVTVLIRTSQLLSTNPFSSLSSITTLFHPLIPSVSVGNGEIYDADLSSSHLFLATRSNILVYALPANGGEHNDTTNDGAPQSNSDSLGGLDLIKTIDLPSISGVPSGSNVTFRAARLHPTRQDMLYSVVNVILPRVKHAKLAKRRAYVLKWRITETDGSFDACIKTIRKVCDGNLTCFDVSSDGKLLAFGASDYSLGVLDSNTLTPLLSILKAHEFSITTLRFSPTSKLLVSGGVDSSIRVVSIPEVLGGQSWSTIIIILIAVVVIIIAFLMRQ